MGVSRALVFHKHILFLVIFFKQQLSQSIESKMRCFHLGQDQTPRNRDWCLTIRFQHIICYSPSILKNVLCLFLQDFVNWNVTQLLIGYTIWFSQSEIVLHSNMEKNWRIRLTMFSRMVGEYRPWEITSTCFPCPCIHRLGAFCFCPACPLLALPVHYSVCPFVHKKL